MTGSKTQQAEGLGRLQDLLARFESFQLGRPPSASLSEYLQFLADEEVITRRTAGLFEALYHRGRYGHDDLDEALLSEAVAGLREAVSNIEQADAAQRSRLADRLQARFPSSVSVNSSGREHDVFGLYEVAPAAAEPVRSPAGNQSDAKAYVPPDGDLGPGTTFAVPIEAPPTAPRRHWRLWSGLLAVWTCAVLAVGYVSHEQLDRVITRLTQDDDQTLNSIMKQRKHLRTVATGARTPRTLHSIGAIYAKRREYAEAIAAFYQVLAHHPDHAPTLNNLAWTLLVADDPWYRDAETAKQLAEKAVSINPYYTYLDTLAEACYQTGDARRAIELEKRAIEKARTRAVVGSHRESEVLSFLENQLEKFQRGIPAETGATPAGADETGADIDPPLSPETE